MQYKGYEIAEARHSGGKVGKGRNIYSTIQVREPLDDGYLVRKSYRYRVGDDDERNRAFLMCRMWINEQRPNTRLETDAASLCDGDDLGESRGAAQPR